MQTPYLGKCHVGDDNHVQRRRSVLLHAGVTARVVLVGAGATVVLPGLTVVCLGDGSLRRGAGGGAR